MQTKHLKYKPTLFIGLFILNVLSCAQKRPTLGIDDQHSRNSSFLGTQKLELLKNYTQSFTESAFEYVSTHAELLIDVFALAGYYCYRSLPYVYSVSYSFGEGLACYCGHHDKCHLNSYNHYNAQFSKQLHRKTIPASW